MRKLYFTKAIYAIALSILFFACSQNEDETILPVNQGPTYLISADTFITRTAGDLQFILGAAAPDLDLTELKYDAMILKVKYKTKYKGGDIEASGLVIMPLTMDEVDMLSFQHGTIAADADAPSNLTISNQAGYLYQAIASFGMIAVIPDFIGFGASVDISHPYYVEDLTASSVVDNLKAAKELAEIMGINFSGDLFLAGYSQGGYATMATHKWIEEKGLENFDLIASFPASGGYDVRSFQEYFFQLDIYDQPFYMAYVVNAYNSTYDWNMPFSDIFNEPYASRITDLNLFNGQFTNTQINDQLNDTLAVLINSEVFTDFETSAKYASLKEQLIENSLTDWTPTIRMFMYHGTADITVPYQNSVVTYDKLIQNGASPAILTFKDLPGADHGSGVIPYLSELIDEVNILRN